MTRLAPVLASILVLLFPLPVTAQAGESAAALPTEIPVLPPESLSSSSACEAFLSVGTSGSEEETDSSDPSSTSSDESGDASGSITITDKEVKDPFPGAIPSRFRPGTVPYRKIHSAAQTYRRENYARVVPLGDDTEVYPYGKEVPRIEVPTLHFSILKLAPNEHAVNRSIGDPQRWKVETGTMGTQGNYTQLIYIKPRQCGPYETNLTIATNQQRTYNIMLESLPCDEEGRPVKDGWTRKVSWYYPDGNVPGNRGGMKTSMEAPTSGQSPSSILPTSRTQAPPNADLTSSARGAANRSPQPRRSQAQKSEEGSEKPDRIATPSSSGSQNIDLRDLNTQYWETDLDRRFPCAPETVGDDGQRTYIRLGDGPSCAKTFPLFRITQDRKKELINYEVFNGSVYVVEGVFPKLALVFMSDNGRRYRAVFENKKLQRIQSGRSRSGRR